MSQIISIWWNFYVNAITIDLVCLVAYFRPFSFKDDCDFKFIFHFLMNQIVWRTKADLKKMKLENMSRLQWTIYCTERERDNFWLFHNNFHLKLRFKRKFINILSENEDNILTASEILYLVRITFVPPKILSWNKFLRKFSILSQI